MLETGDGASRDVVRARSLYERSCKGGLAPECLSLAHLLQRQGERPAALEPLGKACDGGQPPACQELAQAWEAARSTAKALPLYDKACSGGIKPACERAKKLRE